MRKIQTIVLFLLCLLWLSACSNDTTGELSESTTPTVSIVTGWQQENGQTVYIHEDGSKAIGWLELDGSHYYFDDKGHMQRGWLELSGSTYYLNTDGVAVTGEAVIDGMTHHFTADGQKVLLVNPWHAVPGDYQPDLITLDSSISSKDIQVDRSCYDALNAMIAECNRQCPTVCVVSGYRTYDYQSGLYNRKVNYYLENGYSKAAAKIEAAKVVAVPGTSEHQLGLAVDIIDTRSWSLTEVQETLPAQKWLMENSWRYGFTLRYPKGTTEVTGIIYEPWHYRYVGEALAKELYESDLTLEEYLQKHTKMQP